MGFYRSSYAMRALVELPLRPAPRPRGTLRLDPAEGLSACFVSCPSACRALLTSAMSMSTGMSPALPLDLRLLLRLPCWRSFRVSVVVDWVSGFLGELLVVEGMVPTARLVPLVLVVVVLVCIIVELDGMEQRFDPRFRAFLGGSADVRAAICCCCCCCCICICLRISAAAFTSSRL